jgi:membrane protein DedA with SNARE-associated domain
VPIPLPADLVMITVGERVAAGRFPLWLAVAGFEVIAVLGTTALFLACRGPAHRIIARFGPRLGLTQARIRRAATFAETRGRPGLALGRATPGLRTLTVIAAGVSEATCPVCLGATLLADRLPGLAGLTGAGPASPGRDEQPEAQPVMRRERTDRRRPV